MKRNSGRDLYEIFPHIITEDILIRRMTEQDTDALFEVLSNDNVFRYLPDFLHMREKRELEGMIGQFGGRFFRERRWVLAGICLACEPERVIGTAEMFDYDAMVSAVEIGYRIHEGFWGRGIATEAVYAMTGYLFNEIGINRIQATVLPENERSKRVLYKNGFQREGLLRQVSYWKGRGLVDLEMYSLLKGDCGAYNIGG